MYKPVIGVPCQNHFEITLPCALPWSLGLPLANSNRITLSTLNKLNYVQITASICSPTIKPSRTNRI